MRVREATREDEPAVTDQLLRPAYEASEVVAPEFNELDGAAVAEADARRWLDADDRVLFVADLDGELVGHVSGVVTEPPPIYARGSRLHVDGLYVKSAFRRRGVASALVDRIEAWGDERGCEHLGVTVHADNEAARRFYDGRFDLTFYGYRARIE